MTMGYGLIEIPRYFWYKSNISKQLQYLYFKISQLQENRENARDRVDELLYIYNKSKKQYNTHYVYEYAVIDEIIPLEEKNKIIKHPDITFDDIDNSLDDDEFSKKTKYI
eukprot:183562_1